MIHWHGQCDQRDYFGSGQYGWPGNDIGISIESCVAHVRAQQKKTLRKQLMRQREVDRRKQLERGWLP